MLSENAIVRGPNGRDYQLGKELGVGGEGTVYEIPGTSLVAKIYKQTALEQEQKLKYMVWHPVSNVADQHGNKIMTLAWPKDVLYDGNGSFVGYTMPRVEGGVEIYEIERGCTSAIAQAKFPGYTWRLNVLVARNLAAAVMALHQQHYVIGDMNCKNIMVNADGSISMLDTDSCDVTDPTTGHHYKCCVGTEDYLPPELQGVDLRSPRANFTSQTDDFALAVHIFRLLMDNRHPFTCRQLTQVQNSSPQNKLLQNVAQGKCPYIRQIPGFGIPLGAPTLEETVPDYIRQDFIRTFDYTDATALARVSDRTTAAQWVQDLKRLLQECDTELIRCNQPPAHFYLQSKGSCGMCAAKARLTAGVSASIIHPHVVQSHASQIPSGRPTDTYFYDNWYHITEQEARAGGQIAVYAGRNGKAFHPLPPYSDILQKKGKILLFTGKQRLDTFKLHEYSTGCLQKAASWSYRPFWEDLIEHAIVSLFKAIGWALIVELVCQGIDWIAEAIFAYDLFAGYSIRQFGLILAIPPFACLPFKLKFWMVPMDSFWAWSIYLYALFLFVCDNVSFHTRGQIRQEIKRRTKL